LDKSAGEHMDEKNNIRAVEMVRRIRNEMAAAL
jgi:hypothetical protein